MSGVLRGRERASGRPVAVAAGFRASEVLVRDGGGSIRKATWKLRSTDPLTDSGAPGLLCVVLPGLTGRCDGAAAAARCCASRSRLVRGSAVAARPGEATGAPARSPAEVSSDVRSAAGATGIAISTPAATATAPISHRRCDPARVDEVCCGVSLDWVGSAAALGVGTEAGPEASPLGEGAAPGAVRAAGPSLGAQSPIAHSAATGLVSVWRRMRRPRPAATRGPCSGEPSGAGTGTGVVRSGGMRSGAACSARPTSGGRDGWSGTSPHSAARSRHRCAATRCTSGSPSSAETAGVDGGLSSAEPEAQTRGRLWAGWSAATPHSTGDRRCGNKVTRHFYDSPAPVVPSPRSLRSSNSATCPATATRFSTTSKAWQ